MPETPGSSESSLAAPSASGSNSGHGISPIAIVGLSAAIVGAVAGGVGAYLYFGDVGNTYNQCVMTGCSGSQVSAGQTEQTVALSMLYGGGALLVGGAVVFLVFRNSGSGERRPAVQSWWIDPRGSIGLSGRF
jgi:hypothetical protein